MKASYKDRRSSSRLSDDEDTGVANFIYLS